MKILQKSITTIRPYERNNRKHSEKHIQHIAKSIESFGFNQPIVVDEKGVILVGHGRYYASEYLELMKVPVLVLKGLTEEQKTAYRINDNKLATDGKWDIQNLIEEMTALADAQFPLEEYGLDEFEKYIEVDADPDPESGTEKDVSFTAKQKKCPACGHIF